MKIKTVAIIIGDDTILRKSMQEYISEQLRWVYDLEFPNKMYVVQDAKQELNYKEIGLIGLCQAINLRFDEISLFEGYYNEVDKPQLRHVEITEDMKEEASKYMRYKYMKIVFNDDNSILVKVRL